MIRFDSTIDIRCREPKTPTVAVLNKGNGDWVYIVIGTQYGYLRTTSGDIRHWHSYSGARKAAKKYVPL